MWRLRGLLEAILGFNSGLLINLKGLPWKGSQTLARSGVAARGASKGGVGKGVVGEVPKHRRSRWAKPGSANAVMGTFDEFCGHPRRPLRPLPPSVPSHMPKSSRTLVKRALTAWLMRFSSPASTPSIRNESL